MPRYNEGQARSAVAESRSYSEVLRRLGLRPAGGNHKLLRRYVDEIWQIPTAHFDGGASSRRSPTARSVPLCDVLVVESNYPRASLKRRLFAEGLKERCCEHCGQGDAGGGGGCR